jgi:hypothetical protein
MRAEEITMLALCTFALAAILLPQAPPPGAKVTVDHNDNDSASPAFRFAKVPSPSRTDAATKATFAIVDGQRDRNGASLDALHDGRLPHDEDEPSQSLFFDQGSDGGRLAVDLGEVAEILQVNTYSWHPNTRGPQVYRLWAADGTAPGFDHAPRRGTDPAACGWQLLASVDTRPKEKDKQGGQYGVGITGSAGALGNFRHLLFDVQPTEKDDPFGNTFYSEIDVVTAGDPVPKAEPAAAPTVARTADGKYELTIDVAQAPELKQWVDHKLTPVLLEWYPRIVAMLPGEGFAAPTQLGIVFRNPGQGVAATSGTRITCAAAWFKNNLDGEAIGAVVHELVHVAQQYGGVLRGNRQGKPTPGWLTEGIADYVRWFLYEPQSHGADRVRNPGRASYDSSYRITANFLDWVARKYDKDVVRKLNAAAREGRYGDELWQQFTGKPVAELNAEWKAGLGTAAAVAAGPQVDANLLTEAEQKAGWKLLFDGVDLAGWHSFKRTDVRKGWVVQDGAITCADPHDAGDLCTNEQYGAFELVLDYNIAPAGNSGVMFHVTDEASTAWATGPECQLLDNKAGRDPQKAGWLYALYSTETDATKPAGEWNHLRLLITPEQCVHEMNGVKYFEYVLGSDDFKQRVAASKFGTMPKFAQSPTGYVALQGDHGVISFRNVKIRPIEAKK